MALQPKEIAHLIQCGALDGIGESRAAMLSEAADIQRAGGETSFRLSAYRHDSRLEIIIPKKTSGWPELETKLLECRSPSGRARSCAIPCRKICHTSSRSC